MHVEEHLRTTFDAWLLDGTHPERIRTSVGAPDRGLLPDDEIGADLPVSALLYRLWDSTDTVPVRVSMALNLPPDASYGHAAQLLWWLRTGDQFFCTSYAEAVDVLERLDDATFKELYQRVSDYLRNDSSRPRDPVDDEPEAAPPGSSYGSVETRRVQPTRQAV